MTVRLVQELYFEVDGATCWMWVQGNMLQLRSGVFDKRLSSLQPINDFEAEVMQDVLSVNADKVGSDPCVPRPEGVLLISTLP